MSDDKQELKTSLVLYGHPFSSYTWKVLIALYAEELSFEFRILDDEHTEYNEIVKQAGPLGKFPPTFGIGGFAAYMGSTTADMNGRATDYAKAAGRYYSITPVKIPANQNFNVSANFPTAIASATATALIGVILDGFLYRLSQ